MAANSKRILTVGLSGGIECAVLAGLERKGWECSGVRTLQGAENALETDEYGIVLAAECLADGEGYDLASSLMRRDGSLFVAVTLSESCLWVPVVEAGTKTLGMCALHPQMLDMVLGGFISAGKLRSIPSGAVMGRTRARLNRAKAPHHTPRRDGESRVELHQG